MIKLQLDSIIVILSIIWFLPILETSGSSLKIQEDSIMALNQKGINSFIEGDFERSEYYFIQSLVLRKKAYNSTHIEVAKAYNNLGVLNIYKWEYELSLEFFQKAKEIYEVNQKSTISLANVYSNIGKVYRKKGDFQRATEYYNKSLSLLGDETSELGIQRRVELLMGYSILEMQTKDYHSALKHILTGIELYSKKNNISLFTQHNLYTTTAEIYNLLHNNDSAYFYINKSLDIAERNTNFPTNLFSYSYVLLAEYHLNSDQLSDAYETINKAEEKIISASLDSTFYFDIERLKARYYELNNEYPTAIKHFNLANNILISDPGKSGIGKYGTNQIKAISLLKKKSLCLLNWFYHTRDYEHLSNVVNELIKISQLIDVARNSYLTIESKLLLAENESDIFKIGLYCTEKLYQENSDPTALQKAFYFSEKGKSSILESSLQEEQAKSFAGIPASIIKEEMELKRQIAFYKEKIYEEKQKSSTDSVKIILWNNYLFNYSNNYERLKVFLEKDYPKYYLLKYKKQEVELSNIQKSLKRNTTIIEYSLTDSVIYTFVINKNETNLYKKNIQGEFVEIVTSFLNQFRGFSFIKQGEISFLDFETKSHLIYSYLMGSIPNKILKKNLVIIPDDIISYIPFEALVTEKGSEKIQSFAELNYLFLQHSIFYSYSSELYNSLGTKNAFKLLNKTLAIAPEYDYAPRGNNKYSHFQENNVYRNTLRPLPYAKEEIKIVSELTNGSRLIGKDATEKEFLQLAPDYDILHLAMHTLIDDKNPLYSKLVFYNNNYNSDEGLLNTNEIFALKLKAKHTVLSACSSGEGEFKKGEGVMSLSRGFFYAGCPSLLMTLWKVEDKSGLFLMEVYYKYLLKGYSKSKALHKAKLHYLRESKEEHKHPFFWASYILIGNPGAIYVSKWIITGIVCIFLTAFIIFKKSNKTKRKLPNPRII
jgi:CHAT domain-containing protein/tetratricopeptide (TPR) repeat protein